MSPREGFGLSRRITLLKVRFTFPVNVLLLPRAVVRPHSTSRTESEDEEQLSELSISDEESDLMDSENDVCWINSCFSTSGNCFCVTRQQGMMFGFRYTNIIKLKTENIIVCFNYICFYCCFPLYYIK